MKYISFIYPMIIIFLIGCSSTVPFTNSKIIEYQLDAEEIKNVQCFISQKIVLQREVTKTDEKGISDSHTLEYIGDKMIETISFPAMTPCIVDEISSDKKQIIVSFEEADGSTLRFHLDRNGYYKLVGGLNHEYQGDFFKYIPNASHPDKMNAIETIGLGSLIGGIGLALGGALIGQSVVLTYSVLGIMGLGIIIIQQLEKIPKLPDDRTILIVEESRIKKKQEVINKVTGVKVGG